MIDESHVQGSDAWLALRRTKVTASDIPIIMGVSPYKTAKQLFLEKIGEVEPSFPSPAMQYGTEMEPEARETFNKRNGSDVFPCVRIHPENEWLMASIDGIGKNFWEEDILVEIKCPYSQKIPEEIPEHHLIQMQAQMYCSGIKLGCYFVYLKSGVYSSRSVHFDSCLLDKWLPRSKVFYDCMIAEDFTAFEALDWNICNDAQMKEYLEDYFYECQHLKECEERVEWYKTKIIGMCSDLQTKSDGYKIEKRTRKGLINYKKIEALKDIDLEKYRGPETHYWQISADTNEIQPH